MSKILDLLSDPAKFITQGGIVDLIDENAQHDAGWQKDRRWLCAACGKAGIGYEGLATALQMAGCPRPSHGDHAYRVTLVGLMAVRGASVASVVEAIVSGVVVDDEYLESLKRC